jgi:hypothetical protein
LTDILIKLLRKDLRRPKPGDWVAWNKSNWGTPESQDFSFHEAQVMAYPVRSAQDVLVLFNGLPHSVPKNMVYKVMPVIGVEAMHQQFDYNS